MSYPTPYAQAYSYTAFQQSQGDNSFPGTQLDADLAGISTSILSLTTFVKGVLREDGQLQNGSVTLEKLSSDIQLGIPVPTVWAGPGTSYVEGQTVTEGATLYIALADHTSSSSFATDFGNSLWRTIAAFSTSSVLPDNSVDTNAIVDGAVTGDKLDDGAVAGAKIADGGIPASKFAATVGIAPVGTILDYAGLSLPSGYRWCDGAAINRVTYAVLFAALTAAATATATSGSNVLTGVSADLSALGLKGSVIEHAGVPAGTTITGVTATTITLSANASSNQTATARALPFGAGDGSTTFNVPDLRGRSTIARDDMGGTAASRLATLSGMGAAGGEEKHTLTTAELAAHSHGITDLGHVHGVTDPGHKHKIGTSWTGYAAGLGPTYNPSPFVAESDTATTGISINNAATGVTINSAGSGTAHNTLHPVQTCNKIIFAGV